MKKDKLRSILDGLRQCKLKRLLICRNLRGEENGGWLDPAWLELSGHGNLLLARHSSCAAILLRG
jgi:hypothetical protein